MLVYDGLASNLRKHFGPISVGTSLIGLYYFHSTPGTFLLDWNSFLHWGGLTYFTLFTLMSFRFQHQKLTKINRVFLLHGGQMARLQFNSGLIKDVPVSSMAQVVYNAQTTMFVVSVSGDSGT